MKLSKILIEIQPFSCKKMYLKNGHGDDDDDDDDVNGDYSN